MITKSDFYGYELYTIKNGDIELAVCTLGATAVSLKFCGKPMILGYEDAKGYLEGDSYIGAVVGRYANRIAKAQFELNGEVYKLYANEGKNMLHGGNDNLPYSKRSWSAEIIDRNSLRLNLHSPDGDNGFPGNMDVSVTYTLQNNTVRLDFCGVSDKDTYFVPTTHAYFNLDGSDSVLNHKMQMNSKHYLPVDSELIPTGELAKTEKKFDFSEAKAIGTDFDHAFVLDNSHALTVSAGEVELQLHTDFPAVQFYTGSVLPESIGKNKGFCIEPEFYPDSPNNPQFPSALLKKGENFHKYAEFRFSKLED